MKKAKDTASGARMLEEEDPYSSERTRCENCSFFDYSTMKECVVPNMIAVEIKHPCKRFPNEIFKTKKDWCGEFKGRYA